MSFVQLDYLPFLLVCVTAFVWSPRRVRGVLLLAASLGFYAYQSPVHTLLLLASAALDFGVGLGLERIDSTGSARARKGLLACSLVGNLSLLGVFKYASLFEDLVSRVTGAAPPELGQVAAWTLPLGISFYTFQTISYSFDVFRRKIPACRNPLHYLLYVSFFPQLVAGPIERAGRLLPQLVELRSPTTEDFSHGTRLIAWGFFKKTVLADRLKLYVWPVFERPEAYGSFTLFFAATSMLVVLYLDFSAYTDIARGAARLFGVDLVDNFRRPFLSRSMGEFASRWHISLFRWIGDYVHSPLSHGRMSHARLWRNNLLTMGLFGLWHGASWTFLLWGLGSGAAISVQNSMRLVRSQRGVRRPLRSRWGARDVAACLGTTLLASVFVVFFFSPDVEFAARWFASLGTWPAELDLAWLGWTALALALGLAGQALAEFRDLSAWWSRAGILGRAAWFALLLAALVYLRVPEPGEFIYFRF